MTTGYLEFKLIWIHGEKLIRISLDKDGARRGDLNFDETLCFIITLAYLQDTRNIVYKVKCVRNSSTQNEKKKRGKELFSIISIVHRTN